MLPTAFLLQVLVTFDAATAASPAGPPDLKQAQRATVPFSVAGNTYRLYEWTLRQNDAPGDTLTVVAVVAPRGKFRLKVKDVQKRGRLAPLLKQLDCADAIALSNGGFYYDDNGTPRPLGLSRSDNREISPFHDRRYGGFLACDGARVQIIPLRSRAQIVSMPEALQSTPIVVKGGKNDMHTEDGILFDRSAVGSTSDQGAVMIGAFRPSGSAISLNSFAEVIVQMASVSGPTVETALAMDGGPSAHVAVPALDRNYGYSGASFLPNAVCLSSR